MRGVDLVPHPGRGKEPTPSPAGWLVPEGGPGEGGRREGSLTPCHLPGFGAAPHLHPLGPGRGGTGPSPGTALGW